MAEGLENLRIEMDKAKLAVAQDQLSVVKAFKNSVQKDLRNGFATMAKPGKLFDFKGFQNKIGNIFTSSAKSFASHFSSIGSAFSGLKDKLTNAFSNLNVFKAFSAIKDKFGEVKNKVKKFVGKDLETLKRKFFENWYSPEKVWLRQQKVAQRYWHNQWKKEEKKRKVIEAKDFKKQLKQENKNQIKGKEATVGQVYGKIAKAVDKIAATVSWFFSGPGFGIGLAMGLTPPVLILSAAILGLGYLLCKTLETLISPIITIVSDTLTWLRNEIGGPIKTVLTSISNVISSYLGIYEKMFKVVNVIFDKVAKFFDSPISTISNGFTKVAGKISNTFAPKEQKEKMKLSNKAKTQSELENVYNNFKTSFINPTLKRNKDFDEKTFGFFEKVNNKFIEDSMKKNNTGALDIVEKTGRTIKEGLSNLWGSFKDVIKQTPNNETIESTVVIPENSFQRLTESFDNMRADTIQLLSEIKTAVISISKNNIKIGNKVADVGTGVAADTKLQPINVMVNQKDNSTEIINILKKMSGGVDKIANNTVPTENTTRRSPSIWSLEG